MIPMHFFAKSSLKICLRITIWLKTEINFTFNAHRSWRISKLMKHNRFLRPKLHA